MDRIINLVKQDVLRVNALDCIFQLNLPQCYLAAGFVRNLVWDYLHNKQKPTELNDVDVIYFDLAETAPNKYIEYEAKLKTMMPQVNWQVRNQANMHTRNGDLPYINSLDAMRYWPEYETAIAIRKVNEVDYECISAFGVQSLFALNITHNPKRDRTTFESRIESKGWLTQWPKLTISH